MASKSNDALFSLVQSLTKSEKRYFKLHASRHTIGEENNNVLLFDYLDKLEEYDEEELRRHFNGAGFLNKFSITKKRLYDQILHALNLFHFSSQMEAKVYGMLHSAEILFQKSLYNQSRKILISAEKLASKHQLTNALLEVRKKMKMIFEKNNYLDMDDDFIAQIEKEDQEIHRQSAYEDQLWTKKSRLFRLLMQKGPARTGEDKLQFEKILNELEDIKVPSEPTFEANYLNNHIQSAYHFAVNELESSYKYLSNNWTLFQNNESQIKQHPDRFLSVLTNLIYTSDHLGNEEKAKLYLDELRKWEEVIDKTGEADLKSKYFSTLSSIELSLLSKHGEYTELAVKIPNIESGILNFENQLTEIRKAFFYFKMAEVNLALGNANYALKYLRFVIDNSKIDKKEDIVASAHLMSVLVHIELENFNILPYLVKNIRRLLKSRNRMFAQEKDLLSCALKFQEGQSYFDKEDIWRDMCSKFEAGEIEHMNYTGNEYFNFKAWAESKVSKVSFEKLIQKKQLEQHSDCA